MKIKRKYFILIKPVSICVWRGVFAFIFLFLSTLSYAQATVTNLNDSGPGSLRQIVINSSSGDTINFNPSLLVNGSDTLKLNFPISFMKGLVIQGLINGSDTLYISGQDSTQIFYMDLSGNPGGTVVFRDLVLINGLTTGYGGAIYLENADSLIVRDCIFRSNRTAGSGRGGAMYILNSPYYFENSLFDRNHTDTTSTLTSLRRGGALQMRGCAGIMKNVKFVRNAASSGGAIYGHDLTLRGENLSFISNTALIYGNDIQGGGALAIWASDAKFTNSTFFSNYTDHLGGAIAAYSCDSILECVNCKFIANQSGGNGGALATRFSPVQINKSLFHWNISDSNGGACVVKDGEFSIECSTFLNNTAQNSFHQFWLDGCYFSLTNISAVNQIQGGTDVRISQSNGNIHSSIFNSANVSITISGGSIITSGHNIFSNSPSFTTSTDQTNIDSATLALEPLAMYGGFTPTMLPGVNSPALNMGNPNDFSPAQNGPIYGVRDVGAAERAVISYDTTLACGTVTWWGNTYNTAGTYTDTSFNANSIDSVGVLVLDLQDTSVYDLDGTLYSNETDTNTTYQWVDCDNNYTPIAGATSINFLPPANGNYAVILSNQNCVDTSSCYNYNRFSVQESSAGTTWLTFYPNPTHGVLHLQTKDKLPSHVEVIDLTGRSIAIIPIESTTVQIPGLTSGTYLLRWKGSNGEVQVDRVVLE